MRKVGLHKIIGIKITDDVLAKQKHYIYSNYYSQLEFCPNNRGLHQEHWKIGKQIRTLIKQNTGKYPEEMPLKVNLNTIVKALKKAQTQLNNDIKQIK